jgi:ATP-binding cassette subfamily F protein uup
MSLLSLKSVSLSITDQIILDDVDLQIMANDKCAIIGRNGEGKSTLLKIISGIVTPDSGQIIKSTNLKIGYLTQEVPECEQGTVYDVVNHLVQQSKDDNKSEAEDNSWELITKINTVLSRVGLNPELRVEQLSGGMKRRVLLAAVLVNEPDILLLDEPTNHLDIEAIEWLESFLKQYRGVFIIVTHDREFLSKTVNRIIEIDRGKLFSYPGDYRNYLRRKEERLHAEEKHNSEFDKKLKQEEQWIRQGIKARRTRNEGRVRALKKMREQRLDRRNQQANIKSVELKATQSGKVVVDAQNISYSIDGKKIIDSLSLLLMRGDKLGIVGPNGCGKTTLLRLLLAELSPDSGQIKFGTRLKVAYFDQLRAQLDERLSIIDNVAEGRQEITVNGKTKHVVTYLQDFLFSPKRINQSISKLSGGERNRLLLAKLFTQEINMLVMDEPTNDLDIESLELLESMLVDFNGTLLIVSHDREFLNNVTTSVLIYEGDAKFIEYVGGYDDYIRIKKQKVTKTEVKKKDKISNKMSYNEQRELKLLPAQIEDLEQLIDNLQQAMLAPDFYQQTADKIAEYKAQLDAKESELESLYERWETLESKRG